MTTWITWNMSRADVTGNLTLERKVEIFYQRTLGWQLHIADLLANGGEPLDGSVPVKRVRHSGFAVLHICLSYFETIGHYEQGLDGKRAFKAGVRSVFPQLLANYPGISDEFLNRLYVGARCGMYHNSMTEPGLGLGQPENSEAMAYDPVTKQLVISPERLPIAMKAHLEEFRARVLDLAMTSYGRSSNAASIRITGSDGGTHDCRGALRCWTSRLWQDDLSESISA